MPKIPSIGKPHNIRVNDAAYFIVQRRIIEAREKGYILNTQRI